MKRLALIVMAIFPSIGFCLPILLLEPMNYVIEFNLDISEGTVIIKSTLANNTVKFDRRVFQLKGYAGKSSFALIQIQPLGGIPTDLILEPGNITLALKNGIYTIGGTANNIIYQQIRDQLSPYRARVAELLSQSYQAKPEEKMKLLATIDSINGKRVTEAGKLIRENPNYAGLVTLQAIYRKESPSNLSYYLEEFKSFRNDEIYQVILDFFKNMAKMEKGFPVTGFTLPDQYDRPISLESFKGKLVLLDFWYKDCTPCRNLVPVLAEFYKKLKGKGFEIVSISVDPLAKKKEWLAAIKQDGSTWTQLWDHNRLLPKQFNVMAYPHLFLLDRKGQLLDEVIGFDEQKLREILNKNFY